ncbi:hypothetical protein B0T21DRAFT_392765 [Apiosordaria backusii]|uniref:Uncharacterized protein n=1 Tax=Apiosordaria backusii TaxID=314023 RepID=A0AA40BP30_9PEZI|nr:hypothetical protein B0T21DRAFT_392765 [Apiosordaria backusii]
MPEPGCFTQVLPTQFLSNSSYAPRLRTACQQQTSGWVVISKTARFSRSGPPAEPLLASEPEGLLVAPLSYSRRGSLLQLFALSSSTELLTFHPRFRCFFFLLLFKVSACVRHQACPPPRSKGDQEHARGGMIGDNIHCSAGGDNTIPSDPWRSSCIGLERSADWAPPCSGRLPVSIPVPSPLTQVSPTWKFSVE